MPEDQFGPAADRWALRLERRYPHPVEKVWGAVTEPAHLAQRFPSTVEVDLRVGGAMRFGFGDEMVVTGEAAERDAAVDQWGSGAVAHVAARAAAWAHSHA